MTKGLFQHKEFDKIFADNYTRLYMYAAHLTNDGEASRDIVSEVFKNLWENFKKIDKASIHAYLTATVRNKCIDHLRHLIVKRSYTESYIHEAELFYSDYSEELNKDRIVKEMLSELSEPTRQILEQCYLHQKKYNEVASEMNISANTVKKHISKALRILRNKFNGENKLNNIPE